MDVSGGPRTSVVAQPLKAHAHGDPEKQAQKLGHTCLIDKQVLSVRPVSLLLSLTLGLITGNPSSAAQESTGLLAGGVRKERRGKGRERRASSWEHAVWLLTHCKSQSWLDYEQFPPTRGPECWGAYM